MAAPPGAPWGLVMLVESGYTDTQIRVVITPTRGIQKPRAQKPKSDVFVDRMEWSLAERDIYIYI